MESDTTVVLVVIRESDVAAVVAIGESHATYI